jgi:hypothetical protein
VANRPPLFSFINHESVRAFGRLTPFLIAIVVAFVLLQLYMAIRFAIAGQYAFGVFYAVFAFAGLALARALWINRKKFE